MTLKDSFKISTNGLRAHKSRSALTILGIVIGISSIIVVTAVGAGTEGLIMSQIQGLGAQTIILKPGREPQGISDSMQAMFADSLKEKELNALKNPSNVPDLARITPFVMSANAITYQREICRPSILGTSSDAVDIFEIYPTEGVFFTEEEVKQRSAVVVIGDKIKKDLFYEINPIGKKVKINNKSFRVIGVLPAKGQISMMNIDNSALIPYTTVQQYLLGINYFHSMIIEAKSEAVVPRAVEDMKLTLRELHKITDPKKDDFYLMTQEDVAERVAMITGALTVLLVAVAGISLLVGGVGIMNIMLVSVTERTKEIGLRKAVGASNRNILIQFLLESMILTLIGGIIGVASGALIAFLAAIGLSRTVAEGWVFVFPVGAALLGCGVSAMIGLIFGIYPAYQASKKSPMEALRYE